MKGSLLFVAGVLAIALPWSWLVSCAGQALPDSGAMDPCASSSRRVGILTPEERRLFCLHTLGGPAK